MRASEVVDLAGKIAFVNCASRGIREEIGKLRAARREHAVIPNVAGPTARREGDQIVAANSSSKPVTCGIGELDRWRLFRSHRDESRRAGQPGQLRRGRSV